MSELIDRQNAIKDAESWVAVDEHERHLQKNVIEWLKEFPPAELSTNLAEVGTDAISRQAAIEALDEQIEQCDKALSSFDISMRDEFAVKAERASLVAFRETLEYLPPAEPKRGKWILDRSGAYCCSECMEPCATYIMGKTRDKFCKMCGAKMEETNE